MAAWVFDIEKFKESSKIECKVKKKKSLHKENKPNQNTTLYSWDIGNSWDKIKKKIRERTGR